MKKAIIAILLLCGCHAKVVIKPRDYQIETVNAGTYIYEGNRLVGFIPYTGTTALDSLIDKDNQ